MDLAAADGARGVEADGGAEAALAYGGTMNLYVRDGVVRVIEVRG